MCSFVQLAIDALCIGATVNGVSIVAEEFDFVSNWVLALVWLAASVAGALWTSAVVSRSNYLESG